MSKVFVSLLLLCMIQSILFSREFDFDNDYKQWIVLNVGNANNHDFSAGISYNFGVKHFYQIGLYTNSDLSLFGNSAPHISAVTIGFGKRSFSRYHLAAIFMGPTFIIIKQRTNSVARHSTYYTGGMIINLQAFLKPVPEIGIGLDFYRNLNFKQRVYGIRVALHFGNNK